ncbi:MAG: NHL repeat-containing protein [Solirubrobacterales bacterium]|nr:NHL repeat-containing protein [Solirubrobacterales bacterium]
MTRAGNLYVWNAEGFNLDEFTFAGGFVAQLSSTELRSHYARSLAVSRASGEIYLPTFPNVELFNANREYEATWEGKQTPGENFGNEYQQVAVDNSSNPADPDRGEVYVTDYSGKVVDVLKPGGGGAETYVTQITGASEQFAGPYGVAVNEASGEVYVVDSGAIDVFKPLVGGKYEYVRQITGDGGKAIEGIRDIAVDPADGAVYLLVGNEVEQFDAAGSFVDEFNLTRTGEQLQEPESVAVGPEGDVFVADYYRYKAGRVDVFAPTALVPDVTTEGSSEVARTTATLAGTVNPDKTKARYHFEYGETSALGQTTAVQEAEDETSHPATAKLAGLKTSTTYSYRLVAENENGKNYGATNTFTTLIAVEHLGTLPALPLTPTEEEFNGELNANGYEAECWFEYEGGATKKTMTAKQKVGPESKVVEVSEKAGGLEPNMEYHDTFVCRNSLGTGYGSEVASRTLPAPPVVIAQSASNVTRQSAVLHGIVNPNNENTHYYFEYGTTTEYGYDTPELEVGTTQFGERAVQAVASELQSATVYHYRLVAKDGAGVTRGPDATFESLPGSPPTVSTGGASAVTTSSATLEGLVSTSGLVTSYGFEVSTSRSRFGPPTGLGSVGAGFNEAPATLVLHGLAANTSYYYKLVATNADGTSEGGVNEFTTAAYPPDQIAVQELPLLTEPLAAWPVESGATAPSETRPAACRKGMRRVGGRCVRTTKKGRSKHTSKQRRRTRRQPRRRTAPLLQRRALA